MDRTRDHLIAELVATAAPVRRPGRTAAKTVGWLLLTTCCALLATAYLGPFRSGVLINLMQSPRYALEALLGAAAIIALAAAAFRTALPAARSPRVVLVALMLLASWLALLGYDLVAPALAPSMAGKRATCWLEILLYAAPGLGLGLVLLRRLWPLRGALSGALLGLASGGIGIFIMHFACTSDPHHVVTLHVAPGIAVAVLGAIAGWACQRR